MQVIEIGWPHRLGIPLSDISLKIQINNNLYEGRGSDASSNTAISKAFVEAYERYFVEINEWPSSNGVAGHTDRNNAVKNSIAELLERHIFFSNYYSGNKFLASNFDLTKISTLLRDHLFSLNVKVFQSITSINKGSLYFSLTCLLGLNSERPFGVIVGTAVTEDKLTSSEKSLIEAFRFFSYYFNSGKIRSIAEETFKTRERPSLEDHSLLGLDTDYGVWFLKNYIDDTLTDTESLNIDLNKIQYDIYDISNLKGSPPLYFCRSHGEEFINLSPHAVLLNNAKSLLGSKFTNPKPHPFR